MKLNDYKTLASELISEINWYQRNKDNFKGIDEQLHAELNQKQLLKISGIITQIASGSREPQHISEIMANMPEIHAPLSVDKTGELKSCVELAEEALYGESNPHRSPDNSTII
jgi:hypothetical protein